MVIMFSLNRAAPLSIQLLIMCRVFAENDPVEERNMTVTRGDSIIFTCNISVGNVVLIRWTKDSFYFAYSNSSNLTSNFTSQRLRIDENVPLQMDISDVQHEDAGLYRCIVYDNKGSRTIEWNLTVSEEPEDSRPLWYFLYTLTAVIGCILCAACFYWKLSTVTPNQNPVQDQFELQSGAEVTLPQQQSGTASRANNKQRSQYTERLNSIYGLY